MPFVRAAASAIVAALGFASACAPPVLASHAPGGLRGAYVSARDDLHPEGAAFDEVSAAFFTGSLARGDVTRIDVDGSESSFFGGSPSRGRATLGLAVDSASRRLWVCVLADPASKAGRVWVLDLDSAALVREVDLARAVEGASCNDLTVDAAGTAYVTDRERAAIYRIAPDGDPVLWCNHALLTPGTVGLNGIAITPDGATMLVTHYKPATLLRIRMSDPTDVTAVDVGGDPFWRRAHLVSGADGIRLVDDRLYVAFDRRIFRVSSDDGWRTATAHAARGSVGRGVTAVVAARGGLFAANGQTARFLLGLRPRLPFQLVFIDPARFESPAPRRRRSAPGR